MPLFTKCMKCGGWKEMPSDPSAQKQFPTGLMMNREDPPSNLCVCDDEAVGRESTG